MSTADSTPRFELNIVQVIAGTLAAVTAAVVSSFFGIAGTVIGAGIASLVAAIGTALYSHSIRRTQARLAGARSAQPGAARNAQPSEAANAHPSEATNSHSAAVHLPGTPGAARRGQRRGVRWQTVTVSAVLVFGLAMGSITGAEAFLFHRSLWSLVTGRTHSDGSTISQLTQPPASSAAPATPAAREAPTAVPTVTPTSRPRTSPSTESTPSTTPTVRATPST